MKKFLLSFFVIVVFAFYTLYEKQEQSETNVFIPTSSTDSGQATKRGIYKDGEYTGSIVDAIYGNIQVKAIIQNGAISDIQFLQYPNDRQTSIEINNQAMPILKSEAIQSQNTQVDVVSGATDSSVAFQKSLAFALSQAAK